VALIDISVALRPRMAVWDDAAIRSRVAGMTWAENARATHAFLAAALRRPPLRAGDLPSARAHVS